MSDNPLEILSSVATERGLESLAEDARQRRGRADAGLLFLAVVGQFKRGKSTLLNALVGDAILPTGVVPVTSAITVLKYGETKRATVVYTDGRREEIAIDTLPQFVTEAQNQANENQVALVEISVPSEWLRRGLCFVDTPGLGSITARSDEITREFVPHIDAALLVIGADPPLSREELDVAKELSAQTGRVMTVLNKADKLLPSDLDEGARFAATALTSKAGMTDPRVYLVSATEALVAPTRDWPALVQALDALVEGKATLVTLANSRAVARIKSQLLHALAEQRRALEQPLDETKRQIERLREQVAGAQLALGDLSALLSMEEGKLARTFDERREAFLAARVPEALARLHERLKTGSGSRGAWRAAATEAAHELQETFVGQLRTTLEPAAEALHSTATHRFIELANRFVAQAAATSDGTVQLPPLSDDTTFVTPSRVRYTYLMALTSPSPFVWLGQTLMPRRYFERSVAKRASAYLQRLLETNSSRVASDLKDRVSASRNALEKEIRARLRLLIESAETAVRRAETIRAQGAAAVSEELQRIECAVSKVGAA